jgi:hypothetical protein
MMFIEFSFPFNHVKLSGDVVRLLARVDLVGGPTIASIQIVNDADTGVAFWPLNEQQSALAVAIGIYRSTYAHFYGEMR